MMIDQQENLLLKYAKKIRNHLHFEKILERQDMTFDYKPYKIDKLSPQRALIIYQNLRHRYIETKQLAPQPHGWHEYEKRLFVWFMVVYAYYLQKEHSTLESPAEYKQKINFEHISKIFFGKAISFLEFQFLNIFKITDKVIWTQKDDDFLTNAVQYLLPLFRVCPPGRWTEVSTQIFMKSGKEKFISSKNCRQRWQNHLDKSKIKGNWTLEEDKKIIEYVAEKGKKWSKMRVLLQNKRTQHMIKNRYHSLITKNRNHRYEKEHQTSKRLVEKFEEMQKAPIAQDQMDNHQKGMDVFQQRQNQIQISLKEQNLSSEVDEDSLPQPAIQALQKNEAIKQEEIEKIVKDVKKPVQLDIQKIEQVKVEDQLAEIYPFQNYGQYCGYNSYDQFFEFQNAQYMMMCQQYMYNATAPTNDTYVGENPSIQRQPPQEEEKKEV